MSLSPRAGGEEEKKGEKKKRHGHLVASSAQRVSRSRNNDPRRRRCAPVSWPPRNPFVPLLYISASSTPILHQSRFISPPALPSHLYRWNYCQGTVIIEFPDLRTPAPTHPPPRSVLCTEPPLHLAPMPSSSLSLRAVLMYCPTRSFGAPGVFGNSY